MKLKFHILTLFPEMFSSPFAEGVVARAIEKNIIDVSVNDIRKHAIGKHRTVDDYPYGGGPGMLMKPEPIFAAVRHLQDFRKASESMPVILMTPQGRVFNHTIAKELSSFKEMILICGRYEGFDERIRNNLATDEISIGDFVMSGGEIAAMALVDTVSRLIPGVVGQTESIENDSFYNGLLQFPQYTRPASFQGMNVPEILLSGNHSEIDRWRKEQSVLRTKSRRSDLLSEAIAHESSENIP